MAVKKIKLPDKHQVLSTPQIMLWVLVACIPGLIALCFFFGIGSLINIAWLCLCAVLLEALVLICRKRRPGFYLKDYSAVVTAVLLALCIPPGSPWWLGITGMFFAIVIAKQLYGGLGQNLFNPAMVAYAVLLIAFPLQMSSWAIPAGIEPNADAYTGATALDMFRNERGGMLVSEFWAQNTFFGTLSGTGWEWVNAGYLAGGLVLLYKRIIAWHIPAAMLGCMTLLAAIFYDGGSSASGGSPLMHLFGGGTMLGAFFIATDPVTASTTPKGRIIYGALIGLVTYIIRVWGAYPDGIAFAVLLGNFCAPLIDFYTQPRPVKDV